MIENVYTWILSTPSLKTRVLNLKIQDSFHLKMQSKVKGRRAVLNVGSDPTSDAECVKTPLRRIPFKINEGPCRIRLGYALKIDTLRREINERLFHVLPALRKK